MDGQFHNVNGDRWTGGRKKRLEKVASSSRVLDSGTPLTRLYQHSASVLHVEELGRDLALQSISNLFSFLYSVQYPFFF